MSRWSDEQNTKLRDLVRKNIVSYTNLEPNYLFEVSQEHFPDFIVSGPNKCTTKVQCLCKKFYQLAEEFALNGGRLEHGYNIQKKEH
jgi:hypothetical protein